MFNPFNKSDVVSDALPLIPTLRSVVSTLSVAEMTDRDLKYSITKFEKAINLLGWVAGKITASVFEVKTKKKGESFTEEPMFSNALRK